MRNKLIFVGLLFSILISLTNCSGSLLPSDNFIGEWTQVADFDGRDIKADAVPITLRVTKQDLFYLVEITNKDGVFVPYPDESGRYELSNDKKCLNSVAFGTKFSIQYMDANALHENAWLGYFKKKQK